MKHTLFCNLLSLAMACVVSSALAADASTSDVTAPTGSVEYQSPISDYKRNNDAQTPSWQELNQEVADKGHSIQGMAGMDMGSNQDHIEKTGNMGPMKGMDMGNLKSSSHPGHSMQRMEQQSQQPTSDAGYDVPSADGKMDHRHMSADSSMDHGSNKEETSAEENASEENHDHSSQKAMNMGNDVTPEKAPLTFELIPNFHPIAVHFPIALLLISFLVSMSARLSDSTTAITQMAIVGHWTLWLAAVSAMIAVVFGLQAYNSVNHDDAGHAAMLIHRNWAIPTAIGIGLLAIFDAWKSTTDHVMRWPSLLILGILSLALVATGWLGGEVVYRHGIGVLSLPESEETSTGGHDHGHQHGAQEQSAQSGHQH